MNDNPPTSEPTRPGSRFGGYRTSVGVGLTGVLVVGSFTYLWWKAQASSNGDIVKLLGTITIADFGQWLSGIAAALAFIWIVLAYFQQSEELSLQRAEIARLASEARRQAQSLEESELAARREVFFRMFDRVMLECDRIKIEIVRRNLSAFEVKDDDQLTSSICAKLVDEKLCPPLLLRLFKGDDRFTASGKFPILIEAAGDTTFKVRAVGKDYFLDLDELDRYYANVDLLLREGDRCDSDGAFKSLVQVSSAYLFYVAIAELLLKKNHGARKSPSYEQEKQRLRELVAHANELHSRPTR